MFKRVNKALVSATSAAAPLLMVLAVSSPLQQVYAQGAVATNVIEATGTVGVVNKEDRTLTLIDGEGNAKTISVPEEARNFDQIKRGDTMTVGYIESVEVFLAEPGTEPAIEAGEQTERAEEGEMPAGMVAQALQISAKITAIDKENRVLTLLVEDGSEVQKEVPAEVEAFDSLKVGDTIAVRLTRVLAVEVERPEE